MKNFFQRHPLLRDAILFAIPALIFGLFLRSLLLSYSPYAYWGSDSRSFMGFTNGVLSEFYFSINEKRRYLYPLFLFPLSILPGGTLRWLAVVQALMGLLTVLPLAYLVRRTFAAWKWLIIPVTVIYAGLPVFLWYEHELIADTVFFDCAVWFMAGWAAWVSQKSPARGRLLWWWFLVPLAILLLTKPSGKFLWPGIVIALVLSFSWRTLRWPQWVSIGALFLASLTVGDDDQSAWLLYTTVFPMTQLDTPLHAELKAEIRPLVTKKLDHLDTYEEEDDEVHDFLRSPEDHPEYPLWKKLSKDEAKLEKVYHDLAREAILARPLQFLQVGLQRLAGSCNLEDFNTDRFRADYFADRFDEQFASGKNPELMLRTAFGIPRSAPFPPYPELRARIAPKPDSAAAKFLIAYSDRYQAAGRLLERKNNKALLADMRPTWLFYWLALGTLVSLCLPYLRTIGVWSITFGGYLVAVYLVGIEHQRYFAVAWPLLIVLIFLVLDGCWRLLSARRSRSQV